MAMTHSEKTIDQLDGGHHALPTHKNTHPEMASGAQPSEKEVENQVSSNSKLQSQASETDTSSDTDVVAAPPDLLPNKAAMEPEAERTTLQTVIIMMALCASVFLAALDITIITTSLPTMSEYFHSNAGYTWIGSGYLLANAASTPIWGKLSDIWGRKPILLCAAAVFFVGSALAGSSTSIAMLITARAVQGIGGGGLIILSNICIGDLFSVRNRGKYYGVIGMVWAVASGTGPILGGVFTEKASWRWCFYVNLPITAAAFTFLLFFLRLDNPRTPVWAGLMAIDWLGSLLIVGCTLLLLLGLEFGGITFPWDSPTIICMIVFGLVVAGLFVLNEWKLAKYPVMPLRLFKSRSNIAALLVCFCQGFVFIAGSYYIPLYCQAVLGATPLQSGVYLLPFVLSLSLTSGITGIFIMRTGKYTPPIIFGLTLMTIGFGLFIDLDVDANWTKIILFQIVAGVGVGPNFQSPLIALQSKIVQSDVATATATFGFTRNLSTSVSVVLGNVVFQNQMLKKYGMLLAGLGPQLADRLSGGSAGANTGFVGALPPAQQQVARQAIFESLRSMWIMYVTISALGLFVSLFINAHKLNTEHKVTKTGLAAEEVRRQEMQQEKRGRNSPGDEKVADAV